MPPKKQKTGDGTPDIRSFFGQENETPGSSTPRRKLRKVTASLTPTRTPLNVKDENGGDSGEHSHHFTVKLHSAHKEYTIHCVEPCTVLEAIKSIRIISEEIKRFSDENILTQIGKEDRESIVPSHFPCCCVGDGESVILWCKPEAVERVQTKEHNKTILPKDRYSVFYIDKEGGLNTKTKELFRSKAVKKFKFLCVYGEKGMTVEEALKKDGRFIDLGEFTLSDNDKPDRITVHTQTVDKLHQKTFKICLPLKERDSGEKPRKAILDMARMRGVSVKNATEQLGISAEEIYELLREQFPNLKEWMESRFPGDSFQNKLNLRKEKYGKIEPSFKEAYRVENVLKMGDSVCKITVENFCTGTGFVLFDRFILTNAHLFEKCAEGRVLHDDVEVRALFNYKEPEKYTKCFYFSAEKTFIDIDVGLDYAILELKPEGQKRSQLVTTEDVKVPPGLLKKMGPLPENGEACLIGHPGGAVRNVDFTWIIEAEKREQSIQDHLAPFQHTMFIIQSIVQILENQGIENIMVGGRMADKVGTYNTFMYHGSSGSPVFDASGQVFGLHSAGYSYGFEGYKEHVIEFAQPLLTIIKKFVGKLKESGDEKLLKRIEEVMKENPYIKEILHPEPADAEEPMESS